MRIITGLDIETTGLEWDKGHRIIEVAALLYDLDTGDLKGSFIKRVNPQRPIDPGAQAVHGITFEALSGEATFDVVAPMLSRVLQNSVAIVAHNGVGFDIPFVNSELARVGQRVCEAPCVDTMLQARWATPLGKLPRLGELCFACGVEYDLTLAHGAEYDVKVMMDCFFMGFRKGFFSLPESVMRAAA
jgi:DNA polymerase-3 subunit epsilon